jgi:chloramphenicol-sensitive protein RarD
MNGVGGDEQARLRSGLLYALGAYVWWGLMPFYFRVVQEVPAWEILAHRIVWCGVLLAGILTTTGRWADVRRAAASPRTAAALALCSLLLAINWFVYIYAALSGRITQASLGYFLLPLFNVLFGLVVFRERLRPAQWLGVGLAGCGVVYLLVDARELPWIALSLAVSFTIYGVLRKVTPVDGLVGLFIETVWLAPVSAFFVAWWFVQQTGTFAVGDLATDALLLLSGPVTAAPLLCFGQAARRLPLTTMGFLQYISPMLQLLLAVWVFEEWDRWREMRVCFAFIWAALAVVTLDALLRPAPVREDEPLATDE